MNAKVIERIEKECRNWGVLRWRNPKKGERFWGHVYMTIDSKIRNIISEHYGCNGLIKEIIDLNREPISADSYRYKCVEYNSFHLPPHFTVIGHEEWQSKFFEQEGKINYFSTTNTTYLQSPIECVDSRYTSYSKLEKEDKFRNVVNFQRFKRSNIASLLPKEMVDLI